MEDNPAKPLVLAGVEYLFPIYKEANTYPNLMDNGVKGNVEVLQPGALQRQAWQIVRPFFQQAQKDAMGRYKELANTERASKDIRQILPAAHYGQVDTLFVAVNQQQWGNFNPNTNTLELRPAMLDDLGLLSTLLWHFERFNRHTAIQIDFKHMGLEGRRFVPALETTVYRIIQESLTNVAGHADVSKATVRV